MVENLTKLKNNREIRNKFVSCIIGFYFLFFILSIWLVNYEDVRISLFTHIVLISIQPVGIIMILHFFELIDKSNTLLVDVINFEDLNTKPLIIKSVSDIFGFKKVYNFFFPILIPVVGIFTIIQEGIPFNNPIVFYLSIIFFEFTFLVCGYGVNILVFSIIWFFNLSICDTKIETIYYPNSFLKYLYSNLQFENIYHTVYLIILIIAIFFSPYGFSDFMLYWIYSLALLQLGSAILLFLWIHNLMEKVKRRIIHLFQEKYFDDGTNYPINKLKDFVEIQEYLNKYQEWPFSSSSFASLILSITPLILQAYLAWISGVDFIN